MHIFTTEFTWSPGSVVRTDQCGDFGGDNACMGCMEPAAENYDADATIADSSCTFSVPTATMSLQTATWGYEVGWQISAESGEVVCEGGADVNEDGGVDEPYGVNEIVDIMGCALTEGADYTLSCDDAYGDGWGSSWGDAVFGLTIEGTTLCGDFTTGTNQLAPFLYSSDGISLHDICGVAGGDGTSCLGCTDPAAENFDDTATINDGSCIYSVPTATMSMQTDNWASEVSWQISAADGEVVCESEPYTNYNNVDVTGCALTEGAEYTLSCDDEWGDGWGSSWAGDFGLTIEGTTLCGDFTYGTNQLQSFIYSSDGITLL